MVAVLVEEYHSSSFIISIHKGVDAFGGGTSNGGMGTGNGGGGRGSMVSGLARCFTSRGSTIVARNFGNGDCRAFQHSGVMYSSI